MKAVEWIDGLRIFPRLVLLLYVVSVWYTLAWYIDFDIKYETKCDATTLTTLLDRGVSLQAAAAVACPVVDTVGRPSGYTALMSVLVGAGAGIFGFYVNSGGSQGRKEEK